MDPAELKRQIRDQARAAGFDAIGFTTPDAVPEAGARLHDFLARGWHGTMEWMAANAGRRSDPRAIWPEARSVIVLGMNYGPGGDPLAAVARPDRGAISVYARGSDYHDLIKKRLKQIARWLHGTCGHEVKVFCDTAPVMEKPLAEAAGLGWQGKHTNLVSREFGSWLVLGSIFTTAELPPDEAGRDRCGTCRRCLDACPTDAFAGPYRLDARRCISYLTIEHKGHIPRRFRRAIGNRIYGCDDCLAVCPWNRFASMAREAKLQARAELESPPLADLARLDDAAFRQLFSGSPIKRTGRDRFVRNVMIAIGNSRQPALLPVVRERLGDDSPLVRAAAVWALSQLAAAAEFDRARTQLAPHERDAAVRAEWEARDLVAA